MTNIDRILAARDHDLQEFSSDSVEDRFARAAVIRMANDMLPKDHQIHRPRLTVKITPPWDVDASIVGRLAHAIQQATGMLAQARQQNLDVTSAPPSVRTAAPIDLLPSAGATLVFDLAPDRVANRADHELFGWADVGTATYAELAAGDLCESLPPVEDAQLADLTGVLSASPTVRAAVRRIIDTPITGVSTTLTLSDHRGTTTSGLLVPEQISYLRKELKVNAARETRTEEFDGFLDGARGRRRIFYLDVNENRSIEGSIAEDLVDQVRAAEGRDVRVRLEVSSAKGHRDLYRLIDIVPQLGDA